MPDSTPSPATETPTRSTAVTDRALAPDLARGAMLLLIALANAHLYLHGSSVGIRAYPVDLGPADRVVALLQMTFVDGRAYPMFAALFGYGIVQLSRRMMDNGADVRDARRLVRRRGRWMLLFGLVHALLLFSGDIIGAYGLLAVIFAGMLLRASDRTLLVVCGLFLVPATITGAFQGLRPPPENMSQSLLRSMSTVDPLASVGWRAGEWVLLTVAIGLLTLVPALLVGVWAARRRILDEPARFTRALRVTAVVGIAVATVGGLPSALMVAGYWADPATGATALAGASHAVTGYVGGFGFAALAGLVAVRIGTREPDARGPVVTALTAVGQRSMTCYLAQSVVFVAVLAAYGGGLGDRVGVAVTALIAIGTWLATVLLAEALRRGGYRGPFEVLLRHVTYRTAGRGR